MCEFVTFARSLSVNLAVDKHKEDEPETRPAEKRAKTTRLRLIADPGLCIQDMGRSSSKKRKKTKTKRRTKGSGSRYKDASGVWHVLLPTEATSLKTGRVLRVKGKGPTLAIAQERAETNRELATERRTRAEQLLLDGADPNMTVADFLSDIFLEEKALHVRPTTHSNYKALIRLHVLPVLGGRRLRRLTPLMLQRYLAVLAESGATPDLRRKVAAVLSTAFRRAVAYKLMVSNPMELVIRPKKGKRKVRSLTHDEVRAFVAAISGNSLEALFFVALTTGARQGELFGLQLGDVDLGRKTISVERALVEIHGELTLSAPKTDESIRTIDLDDATVEILKRHMAQRWADGRGLPFLFVSTKGFPLRRSNVLRRQYRAVLKAAGITNMRFHDLRHTCATLLLLAGVSPLVVANRLGHAKPATTLGIYGHVLPNSRLEAVEKMNAILLAARTPPKKKKTGKRKKAKAASKPRSKATSK